MLERCARAADSIRRCYIVYLNYCSYSITADCVLSTIVFTGVHIANHRYNWQPSISGHAAIIDLQRTRLHSRLLGGQSPIAWRAACHLPGDCVHPGLRRRQHSRHARRQQMRRNRVVARSYDVGGRCACKILEMRLHGDVCQDWSQRKGTVPRVVAAGKTQNNVTSTRHEIVAVTSQPRSAQG